jgi:hypothetical protein
MAMIGMKVNYCPFVELGPKNLVGDFYGYFLLQQISNPYFWEKLESGGELN